MVPKLALYSDRVDERALRLIGKARPTVGFVPSGAAPEGSWFAEQVAHYAALGASMPLAFGLDGADDPAKRSDLLACDAIHLSGGNTFGFLKRLRKRGMVPILRDYVAQGGVLIGTSAGAILLTPDISSARLCGDANHVSLTDLVGLGLVDFAFSPHDEGDDDAILGYQRTSSLPLLACPDGGGVVVEGDRREAFGGVRRFEAG